MKIVLLVLVLVIATTIQASDYKQLFQAYKKRYNKMYDAQEELYRFKIFKENVERIREHNTNNNAYKLGINQFTDSTYEELATKYLNPVVETSAPAEQAAAPLTDVPDAWDWRTQGVVTPIKDQGQCGSCWAFGSTECVEGCVAKATGTLISLSEQEMVDCVTSCYGCSGGLALYVFNWIIQKGGICTEKDYPYVAKQQTCKSCTAVATIGSATQSASQDETALKNNCYTYGPISVSIYVMNDFFSYTSGVYYNPSCPTTSHNHAVLVVGYGHDNASGMDYWIVKNSWGPSWGLAGYVWMARNKNGMCAIASYAYYLQGCKTL
jgi:C1A family cysteine protease